MTTTCPECAADVTFAEPPRLSEVVECGDCHSELEVMTARSGQPGARSRGRGRLGRMTEPARLALLASRVRHEERRLHGRAGAPRHRRTQQVDTRTLHSGSGQLRWPVVLVREIGSIRARYAAWTLEAEGSRVLNSAQAIEVCSDKWRTTLALQAAGVPTPAHRVGADAGGDPGRAGEIGYPAVLKPLTGSWGRLVTKLDTAGRSGHGARVRRRAARPAGASGLRAGSSCRPTTATSG